MQRMNWEYEQKNGLRPHERIPHMDASQSCTHHTTTLTYFIIYIIIFLLWNFDAAVGNSKIAYY